ncbi:hypothetical protein [Myxococcus landrumensis]|uniref:Uncharacterized protein n=1 Tax=Myxococcus landrumensis TaxID=2813577 RepID=A0ABX7NFR3_9BACT|nr:hypothetical protein [Myxococcus landrumus]QSQ17233.1 hypothetical protein JY572_14730 [Myxococcus landrumus]
MTLLGHTFRHTFHLAKHVSTNAGGESEYAAPEPHSCRYQGATKRIVASDGSERVTEAVLYTAVEVHPQDYVYPPGADLDDYGAGRCPLRVTPRNNLAGELDHYEVYL